MTLLDPLRPPGAADPSATAYKDWLHLNVFVPDRQVVALINTSLHGPPADPRSRAVGVALAHGPDGIWTGGMEVGALAEAGIEERGIMLRTVSVASDRSGGTFHARVDRPGDGIEAALTAMPLIKPLALDLTAGFGSGWIGWTARPLLSIEGKLALGGQSIPLDGAWGYHDHNWGRWFWGEDAAWEWGTFLFPGPVVVVFARATDKAHSRSGPASLFAVAGGRSHGFRPDRVRVELSGNGPAPDRRLPGALAAIHPDRRRPDLPGMVRIEAESGASALAVTFTPRHCAQLLLAEPTRRGTTFINELSGTCRLTARIDGEFVQSEGMGIFEYVE